MRHSGVPEITMVICLGSEIGLGSETYLWGLCLGSVGGYVNEVALYC